MTNDNVTDISSARKGGKEKSAKPPKDEAADIADKHVGADEKTRGPSQASQLVALARDRYDTFMSEDGRPYGVVKQGANIALPLRGRAGLRSQLARMFTNETGGSVPSQSALADAMVVLEGDAAVADPRVPHVRVARHDGGIVVDLGTADGRCVIVGPDGWRAQSRSPVLFRRSGAMKPLPDPVHDGDGLAALGGLLNTTESGFRLLVAWLVASFIPDLPHPILTFRGEQGTGKSYAAKMVISIIDPSGAPKRTAPRDIKAWATQAFNSWALCLDNVSTVPDWMSDALCRAVTGDGIVDRALYTDDDVVVLEFRRVLALTTIDAGALAGDLAERLLVIELNLIPDAKRREESEMDQAHADAHAAMLASLFDLLAKVLKALPDVDLKERPRMADFARVLAAVDHVQGWKTLDGYKATTRSAVADALEGDLFAAALAELVRKAFPNELKLTAGEIHAQVRTPDKPPRDWPKDATRAGGRIKRLAPSLRTIGIHVDDSERQKTGNRSRLYAMKSDRPNDTDAGSESDRKPAPAAPPAPGTDPDLLQLPGAGAGAEHPAGADSTRSDGSPGAGGADAGADETPAPVERPSSELAVGAAGAAGAEMRPLSEPATQSNAANGVCAKCGQSCRRYGEGGNPLCSNCRTKAGVR